MSTSAIGATPGQVHAHHHYRRPDTATSSTSAAAADPLASTDGSGATSGATASKADASAGSGFQKFAAELQSILISAQSGEKAATTAGNAATAADPAGATDPTAPPNSGGSTVRHLADRLQDLLSSGGGSTTTDQAAGTDTNPATSLQSVLDRLQSTLQQTLQSYGTAAAAKSSTSLTA